MASKKETLSKSNSSELSKKDYEAYYEESLAFAVKALNVYEIINSLRVANNRVELLEAHLKEEKEFLKMLQEFAVPETLRMAGAPLDRFPLDETFEKIPIGFTFQKPLCVNGDRRPDEYLRVSAELRTSIASATQYEAERWLTDRGYGDKVSRKEVVDIHAQTLKKAVREALESNDEPQKVRKIFQVYQFDKAEIKISRKKNTTKSNRKDESDDSIDR